MASGPLPVNPGESSSTGFKFFVYAVEIEEDLLGGSTDGPLYLVQLVINTVSGNVDIVLKSTSPSPSAEQRFGAHLISAVSEFS
jgi:hypothetical protein